MFYSLHVCQCTMCILVHLEAMRILGPLELEFTDGCWEWYPSCLQEEQMLLAAEPSGGPQAVYSLIR